LAQKINIVNIPIAESLSSKKHLSDFFVKNKRSYTLKIISRVKKIINKFATL
jgi:hypothetical protein